MKSQGITKITEIHPFRTMNVNGNTLDRSTSLLLVFIQVCGFTCHLSTVGGGELRQSLKHSGKTGVVEAPIQWVIPIQDSSGKNLSLNEFLTPGYTHSICFCTKKKIMYDKHLRSSSMENTKDITVFFLWWWTELILKVIKKSNSWGQHKTNCHTILFNGLELFTE